MMTHKDISILPLHNQQTLTEYVVWGGERTIVLVYQNLSLSLYKPWDLPIYLVE